MGKVCSAGGIACDRTLCRHGHNVTGAAMGNTLQLRLSCAKCTQFLAMYHGWPIFGASCLAMCAATNAAGALAWTIVAHAGAAVDR